MEPAQPASIRPSSGESRCSTGWVTIGEQWEPFDVVIRQESVNKGVLVEPMGLEPKTPLSK
jgi:hypothetical protein